MKTNNESQAFSARGFFSDVKYPFKYFMDININTQGLIFKGSVGYIYGNLRDSRGFRYEIPWIQFDSVTKSRFGIIPGIKLKTKDGTSYRIVPVNAQGKWKEITRQSFIEKVNKAKPEIEDLKKSIEEDKVKVESPRSVYEGIGNFKCFKCESTEQLKPYTFKVATNTKYHYKLLGPDQITTFYDVHRLPVCKECLKEFTKWNSISSKNFLVHFLLILLWIITIGLEILYVKNFDLLIIFIILGIIIAVSYTIIRIILIRQEFNPFKYVKFKRGGSVFIRSSDSTRWIGYSEWISSALGQQTSKTYIIDDNSKLEDTIFLLFKENKGKAFTLKALSSRLENSIEVNIKSILKRMIQKGKIQQVYKNDEFYYFL